MLQALDELMLQGNELNELPEDIGMLKVCWGSMIKACLNTLSISIVGYSSSNVHMSKAACKRMLIC